MFKSSNPDMQITNMGWTTVIDLKNKLVIHVALNVTQIEVDGVIVDPDGIPLVWVEGKYVTRVRKMTEEEFVKYVTQFGVKMEIDMRFVHMPEKDVPKKE